MSASSDINSFLRGMKQGADRALKAAIKAVDQFGEHVVGDGQELAPVDKGFLKASGTSTPAKMNGDQISKEIGFNADYAAAVHENLEAHHDVGQAKYLEEAMKRNKDKFVPFVAEEIKKAL